MASRIQGITVEIGGDTTKLTSALKGVNGEIRNTQSQLKDVEKLLKLDPSNTELLSQKQRLLNDAVNETKTKLEALKSASEQANKALEDGTITKDQYDALQREIIDTENSLKNLESQANKSAGALEKIGAAGEKVKSAGTAIEGAGKKMTAVSAGIVGAGAASAKMAMDFEDSMAKVNTIADTSEVPLDNLQKSILDLSNQTGISSSEIAQNVYDAISAGQKTGDAVNFVSNSTKLAKAGFADAGAALDVLTTILNAYGLEASEVSNVSDMLIQTQNLGKTTVGDLASTMGKVIPTANAYGVSLDQLCSGYAIMTANGVATAESTTYMNSMLNELGKAGTGVSNILKEKTGKSFAELMASGSSLSDVLAIVESAATEQGLAFSDMWSSAEAGKAGLILLGDSAETFNGTLDKMRASTGATDTAFGKLQTNSYSIQIAINQLKNTAIELGTAIMTALAPVIASLSEKISALTKWFSGLSDGQKRMIITIAGIVAAIGPALIIIGKIITAVGTIMTIIPKLSGAITVVKGAFTAFNAVLMANPIMLVVAAIAALVAGFVYLWNNCDGFRQFWVDLWENIKSVVSSVVDALKGFFTGIIDFVKTNWQALLLMLVNPFAGAFKLLYDNCEGFRNFINTFLESVKQFISTAMAAIKNTVVTVWNGIQTAITTVINAISTFITTAWNGIKTTVTTVVNGIKTAISTAFNAVLNGIKTTITNIVTTIKTGFNNAVSFITGLASSAFTWGKDIIDGIVNGIKSCIGKVKDAVTNVANTIKSFLHFSVPDEGPLTDYESWMPDFMSGLAKGIESSRGLVTKEIGKLTDTMNLKDAIPNMEASLNASVGGSGSASENGSVTLNQPIMVDGKVLTTVVSQIQYARGQASLRNMGTV